MRSICLLMLIFINGIVQGQPQHNNVADWMNGFDKRKAAALDSLSNYPAQDTARINRLIRLINTAYFQQQRRQLVPYWKECLQLSKQRSYSKGLAAAFLWNAYYRRGEQDLQGFHRFTDSAITYSRQDTTNRAAWANIHRIKGLQYQEEENYHAALKHYFEALRYYDTVQDVNRMHLLQNISSSYLQLNNLAQAEMYARKGALLADILSLPKTIQLQAYATLASVLLKREEPDEALPYLQKVDAFMPDTIERALSANHYLDMGHYFFKKQHYDSSLQHYQRGYELASSGKHKINTYGALNYLFQNTLLLGRKKEAYHYATLGLAEAAHSGKAIYRINALLNMSDYEAAAGNTRKAFAYLKKAVILKDQFSRENNQTSLNNLAVLYETAQKEHTIQVLDQENQLRAAALERQSFRNKVYGILLLLLAFLLLLIYRYYVNQQKIQQQQVQIQQQKIVDLEKDHQLLHMTAMLRGQEEERSRIARDLHDGIGSLLSGIKLSFTGFRENGFVHQAQLANFDRSLAMLDNSIADLRRIAYNLMPDALLKFGLPEAVEDLCDMIRNSTSLQVSFQYTGEPRNWEPGSSIYLYRIIQELVNNVVKHAQAKNLLVEMTLVENSLTITVEDDGVGFDPDAANAHKGNGLNNIRYRTELLGGNAEIITAPAQGTSIILAVDLVV